MTQRQRSILAAVRAVLKETEQVFESDATQFFTENDIVCHIYARLMNQDKLMRANDKNGQQHLLLHTEYPTPFKCSMTGSSFVRKADSERYRRGHFDLVVLNPDFVERHSFAQVKAQKYDGFKLVMRNLTRESDPVVLCGIELMYSRDPLRWKQSTGRTSTVSGFVAKVRQDVTKLAESIREPGFMNEAVMLTFVKGTQKDIRSYLVANCKGVGRAQSRLCFAD